MFGPLDLHLASGAHGTLESKRMVSYERGGIVEFPREIPQQFACFPRSALRNPFFG